MKRLIVSVVLFPGFVGARLSVFVKALIGKRITVQTLMWLALFCVGVVSANAQCVAVAGVIKRFTNDSLILLDNGEEKRLHNQRLEFNNNLKFSKITITIEKYYETPQLVVVLDSLGNIFAEGRLKFFAAKEKIIKDEIIKKNFKLNSTELNMIDSLFKFSCIDKTDTIGWDSGDDGWPKSMKFEYNNKSTIIRTIDMTMPHRIQPIYYHLIERVINETIKE